MPAGIRRYCGWMPASLTIAWQLMIARAHIPNQSEMSNPPKP